MTEENSRSKQHKELRARAERQISQRVEALRKQPAMTSKRLIQELEVHQVELQMQNEELQRTQLELQAAKARYFDLFDSAPIGYFTLYEIGVVKEVNLTGANMLGRQRQDVAEKNFSSFITRECQDRFYLHRNAVIGSGVKQTCELKFHGKDGAEFDAQIISSLVKNESGGSNHLRVAVIDITERKKAEDKLHEYQTKLKNLTHSILNVEDRAGQRIAMGLHDNICQKLVMTKVKLESLLRQISDANLTDSLKTVSETISEVIQDAYSLTFDLSNPILHEIGFTTAVEKLLTEELGQKHGITIEFNCGNNVDPLPKTIRMHLFRIVHELLMNIIRHAEAHNAMVSICKNNDQLHVTVKDDGTGFENAQVDSNASTAGKFGLFSIREQLEHLGGRLQIESEPGRGTTATIIVPLQDI